MYIHKLGMYREDTSWWLPGEWRMLMWLFCEKEQLETTLKILL